MQSLGLGVLPLVSVIAAAAATTAAIPAPSALRVPLAVAASVPHARHRRRCGHGRRATEITTAAATTHSAAAAVGGHPHLHLVQVFFLLLPLTIARYRSLPLGTASVGLGVIKGLAGVRREEEEDDQPQGHARLCVVF